MLRETLRTEDKPHIITASTTVTWGLDGVLISRLLGVPFIFDMMDFYPAYEPEDKQYLAELLQNFVISRSTGTTCVSPLLEAYANKVGSEKTLLLPNGFESDIFHPIQRRYARSILGLSQSKYLITYVGAMEPRVEVNALIEALSILITERRSSNLVLVLVGSGSEHERLMRMSRERGIEHSVSAVGEVPHRDVPLYLNAADILVLPNAKNLFSQFCFPYKLAEYMACRRPIIVSNVGVLPEIVVNNQRGLVYKWGDPRDLADKIEYLIQNPEFARELAHDAYAYATVNLSWMKIVGDLSTWMQKIVR
jgi:glycosyltransferase involved in cell wall biosynthesis